MQIKNKIFPYPVLNHNENFSSYLNSTFEMSYNIAETEDEYILKDFHFFTNSTIMNNLYDDGKISIVLIIECSYTVYRKYIVLEKGNIDIKLSKINFNGKVEVSMFAYATESFFLVTDETDEDYKNIKFEIDKYDILAINDGITIEFFHKEKENNFASSIFSIIVKEDLEPGVFIADFTLGKKITISLSREDFDNYKIIYAIPDYKEVFFAMILVPTLVDALNYCKEMASQNGVKDLDEIVSSCQWFSSIISSYKRIKNKDLNSEDFVNVEVLELAQLLLGQPFSSALKKLYSSNS